MSSDRSRNDKGSLLEDLVALVHRVNGLQARARVRLPVLSNPSRSREIDVLLNVGAGPYVLRLPIECKNRGKPVSLADVAEFRDRLEEVGLNVRDAVYVSAVGFLPSANARAKELGIRTMRFDGLNSDRLSQQVSRALSNTVFLLPYVKRLSYASPVGSPMLFNANQDYGGIMFDLIWKHWLETDTAMLGTLVGSEPIPAGWGHLHEGRFVETKDLEFELCVYGHLLVRQGVVRKAVLSDADTGTPWLGHINATFESPFGTFRLQDVRTEAELASAHALTDAELITVARVKVPRIIWASEFGDCAWLPSEKAINDLWVAARENPQRWLSGVSDFQFDGESDLASLFQTPSKMYVEGLRAKLGSTWSPSLWEHVTGP